MALLLSADDSADEVRQLNIGSAAAHELVQIVFPDRKQAGANLAVRGDTNAAAVAAEGMRDGSDDSDLPDAVVEAITPRGFAAAPGNFDQGTILGHARENLIESQHHRRRPDPVFLKRHEFNEAHDHAFFAGKHTKGNDLVLVETAHEHAIHLHRPQLRLAGGADPGQDMVEAGGDASYTRKTIWIDGIHADGNSNQAGIFQ